jgi:hypothetical protein
MDTERRSVTRPDGRKIDFLVAGPPDGLPLVLHEGTGRRLFEGAARTRLKLTDVTSIGPDGVTIQRYTCA